MSVLQVLHIPDERLRKVAKPVEEVNAEIQRIVDDMFETMYAEEGIGLAATQVDIHQRIIVIDVSENRDERLVLINPELLEKSGETGIEEGCLSIPEQRALVPRAEKVKIRALDRDGKPFELEADGLLAICIQHEMDHLVGKLFMDYLSPLKQQRIRQKVEKLDRSSKKRPHQTIFAMPTGCRKSTSTKLRHVLKMRLLICWAVPEPRNRRWAQYYIR